MYILIEKKSVYVLETSALCVLQIFSPRLWIEFNSLKSTFNKAKVLNFNKVQIIYILCKDNSLAYLKLNTKLKVT